MSFLARNTRLENGKGTPAASFVLVGEIGVQLQCENELEGFLSEVRRVRVLVNRSPT
jgi:hypothetical protein